MGDVILALPALQAIREKFPAARLTALVGKSSAMIARLAGVFDEEIVVDRRPIGGLLLDLQVRARGPECASTRRDAGDEASARDAEARRTRKRDIADAASAH